MKIFCIGLNKTCTTSLHTMFMQNGLKSSHDSDWVKWSVQNDKSKFIEHDCFSDGLGFSDLEFILNEFRDVKLILNTRNLDRWFYSEYNHVWLFNQRSKSKRDLSEEWLYEYLAMRNTWHNYILNNFNDAEIINIENDNTETTKSKLSKLLERNIPNIPHINRHTLGIDKANKDRNKAIVDSFLKKHVDKNDWSEDLVIDYLPKEASRTKIKEISQQVIKKYHDQTTNKYIKW